jgi:hypothetical protein
MPNDCTNILTISASSKEELDKIIELVRGDDRPLSFNSIVPTPEEEKENWYNWRIENWGTKWDAYEFHDDEFLRLGDEEAKIGFMTAWSPPAPAIKELSAQFPQAIITLFYYELGMDFCGEAVYSNAEVIDNQEFTMTSEEGKDFLNERGLSFGDDEEGEEWDDEEGEKE